jgi:hypothetical protein
MLKKEEIQEIYLKTLDSQLSKEDAVEQLISIIENNRDPEICASVLETFGDLEVKDDKIFKILENFLISDEEPLIRAIAAKILLNLFPKKSIEPIKWIIRSYRPFSPFLMRYIGYLLEKNIDKEFYNTLRQECDEEYGEFYGFDWIKKGFNVFNVEYIADTFYLIRNNDNDYLRVKYIESLNILPYKREHVFKYLEELLSSNLSQIIKEAAAQAILHDFPVKDMNPLDWREHLDKYWEQIHVREGVVPEEAEILGSLGKKIGEKLERYYKEEDEDANENLVLYWINEAGHVIGIYFGSQDISLKTIPEELSSFEYLEELTFRFKYFQEIPEWTSRIKKFKI